MRILALAVVLVGCRGVGAGEPGSGTAKSESRQVPAFTKIALSGPLNGDIAVAAQAVEISGDDNLVPLVTTEVDGSLLRVGPKKQVSPKLELLARVSSPTLTGVTLSGSNTVKLRDVASETFEIVTSGSSRLVATGTTKKLNIHVSGSATIDTLGLAAEAVTIEVSGSGDVDVSASGMLDVQISGSGRVRYAGTPQVKKQISGSGTVEPK